MFSYGKAHIHKFLIGNLYFMVGKDRLRGERKFGDCAFAMIDYFPLSISFFRRIIKCCILNNSKWHQCKRDLTNPLICKRGECSP